MKAEPRPGKVKHSTLPCPSLLSVARPAFLASLLFMSGFFLAALVRKHLHCFCDARLLGLGPFGFGYPLQIFLLVRRRVITEKIGQSSHLQRTGKVWWDGYCTQTCGSRQSDIYALGLVSSVVRTRFLLVRRHSTDNSIRLPKQRVTPAIKPPAPLNAIIMADEPTRPYNDRLVPAKLPLIRVPTYLFVSPKIFRCRTRIVAVCIPPDVTVPKTHNPIVSAGAFGQCSHPIAASRKGNCQPGYDQNQQNHHPSQNPLFATR
jgi:hypothetical protein